MSSSNSEINDAFRKSCLREIKKLVAIGSIVYLDKRSKNVKFMRKYGLLIHDINNIIFELTPRQCVAGPEEDRDGFNGYIFKFKSNYIEGTVIYIKIRYNPPEEVVCISFHDDE